MTMKHQDIADCARTLSLQLASGIPVVECASLMSQVQPTYAGFWESAASRMSNGSALSQTLEEVWPSALVAIVAAGERSGKLDGVLKQIEETVRLQIAMQEEVRQLKKPISLLLFGFCISLFMMLYVIPNFNKGMRLSRDSNVDGISRFSTMLSELIMPIWMPLAAVLVLGLFSLYTWATSDEGKKSLIDMALSIPLLGPALMDFHFSIWAKLLGTILQAGIPLIEGLSLTINGLPERMRSGVWSFEREINELHTSVQQAADSNFWEDSDMRHDWPLYLRRAFISGEKSGKTDDELRTASELIMEYAQRRFKQAVSYTNTIVFASNGALAFLIAASLYMPVLNTLKQLR